MGTAPIGRMGDLDDIYMGPRCRRCGHHKWDHTLPRGWNDFSKLGSCRGTNANFPSLPQIPCRSNCQEFQE